MFKCTVYDVSGRELEEASSVDAIIWEQEGTIIVLEYHPDKTLRSVRKAHPLPSKILLKRAVKMKQKLDKRAPLTNENLFTRDARTCQYCGRHQLELDRRISSKTDKPRECLTRDHITPKDRGGENSWENCITSCSTCNGKKANRTPSEANMKLRKRPTVPTYAEIKRLEKQK